MMMVIANHVADQYLIKTDFQDPAIFLIEGLSHCADPLFLMLTGIFALDRSGEIEPERFWKKSLIKLGIPTAIFAALTWAFELKTGQIGLWIIKRDIIEGWHQHYPHWYMAMLTGVYFVLPFAARARKAVSKKTWACFALIYFVWAIFSTYYQEVKSAWGIAESLTFFGYVLLGSILKEIHYKKDNIIGTILIVVGCLAEMLDYYIIYQVVQQGGSYYTAILSGHKAPLMIVGVVLIFIGFCKITVNRSLGRIAGYSFVVYLSQRLVLSAMYHYGWPSPIETVLEGHNGLLICVMTIIVFALCYLIAAAYSLADMLVRKSLNKLLHAS